VFYASIKNSLTAFYAKFMTFFYVFYSNLLRSEIVRVFYTKFRSNACTYIWLASDNLSKLNIPRHTGGES
jgi:hypothetical protein